MTRIFPGAGLVVALAAAAAPMPSTVAAEKTHTVHAGESISGIARQYYGQLDFGTLVLKYNGRSGNVIRVGEKLKVPYCEIHEVRPGESWSRLARRYTGRSSDYTAIAMLNGVEPERALQVGQRIVMPVALPHDLRRGETLAVLAERYYGDPKMSRVLLAYNEIEDPRSLSIGERVNIPVVSLVLKPGAGTTRPTSVAPPPSPPPATDNTPVEPAARFSDEIGSAAAAFDAGEYARARKVLESTANGIAAEGTATDRREHARLLAFVYVAFDLPQQACKVFDSRGAGTDPERLDPDLVSPKIRDTLSQCETLRAAAEH